VILGGQNPQIFHVHLEMILCQTGDKVSWRSFWWPRVDTQAMMKTWEWVKNATVFFSSQNLGKM